jgi:hypothetical protein
MPEPATELESRHVPNGRRDRARLLLLSDLDGRRRSVARLRQVESQVFEDLGGEREMTEVQRQLARRTAMLSAVLEDAEARWATGEQFDLPAYCVAANTLRRLAVTIGLGRHARDVSLLDGAD